MSLVAVMETNKGTIRLDLYAEETPSCDTRDVPDKVLNACWLEDAHNEFSHELRVDRNREEVFVSIQEHYMSQEKTFDSHKKRPLHSEAYPLRDESWLHSLSMDRESHASRLHVSDTDSSNPLRCLEHYVFLSMLS